VIVAANAGIGKAIRVRRFTLFAVDVFGIIKTRGYLPGNGNLGSVV